MLQSEQSVKLYLIEGGPALDLIKKHIASRDQSTAMKREILAQLGINPEKFEEVQVWSSSYDGGLQAVSFNNPKKLPKGFDPKKWTVPDSQGRRTPKRNSDIHKVFYSKDAKFLPAESMIIEAFNVPTRIAYATNSGQGYTSIGRMMSSCGFLWLDKENGPFAMWTPDVETCVEELRALNSRYKSFKVLEGTDKWKLDIEGVRPILQEEWDLLVAQKNLKDAVERQKKAEFMKNMPAALKKPMPIGVRTVANKVLKTSKEK